MIKYLRNSKTISGRLNDEMVMMSVEQGRYFSLNQVATRIWDLLEMPLSAAGLCSRLAEEYDIDPGRCMQETTEHLEDMVSLGLILKRGE